MLTGFMSLAVLDKKEKGESGLVIGATIEPKVKVFSVRDGTLVE